MKNRKLLLIVSLVLAMTMSLGGTLAYLSDTDADVNVMTLGSVTITQNEQERDADGNLVAFTPNKPAMPAVGPIEWTEKGEGVVVNGTEYKVFTDDLKNVVDKIVTVTNTGKSDAYVRTIVAIEAPDYDPTDLIHLNYNVTDVKQSSPYTVEIDGVKYVAFVYTYNEVLGAGKTSAPSLMQLFLDAKTTNEDVAKFGDTWEVLVLSQAVQADGFDDATTALNTAFNDGKAVTGESIKGWFEGWAQWGKEEIGTPGDKNDTNNPPVIAEITVDSVDALIKAVADGYTVIGLADGEYDIDGLGGVKGITLTGSKNAVLKLKNEGEDGCDYAFGSGGTGIGDVTFNGITIDTTANTGNYKGFAYMKGTYNNCNFVGAFSLNNANDYVFNNCTFDFKNGYFWTWGANSVSFNECTFNGNSKNILAHGWASTKITINNCDFAATEKGYASGGTVWTAAVEIDPAGSNTYTIDFTGENTINDMYAGWTRIKDDSTGHIITGLN